MNREEERRYIFLSMALQSNGITFPWRMGDRLVRGFADYGFEEFIVLQKPSTAVSLYSGEVITIPGDDAHQFCILPSLDLLEALCAERGIEIKGLHYLDQRHWQATLLYQGEEIVEVAGSLVVALLRGVTVALGIKESEKKGRSLIVS